MSIYLAPTDFSEDANLALKEAARRARLNDAELLLLHVHSSPSHSEQIGHPRAFPNVEEETLASIHAQLNANWAACGMPDLRFRAIARLGVVADEICAVADEENVDLIVMAKHSKGRLRELLLGGTTAKVVREAPCSVLVYRPRDA